MKKPWEELTATELEELNEKYKKYEYRMPAPPVCTVFWNCYDWIKWIYNHGEFK